jgi:transcriptional regulator with XRE-family HTH domain
MRQTKQKARPPAAGRAGPLAAPAAVPVGERLRAMRERHGMTINGLGRLAGVPPSTISKIENGLLKPSLVNAIALASALGENLGFLVDRYRDRPQPISVVRLRGRELLEFPEMGFGLQDMNGNFPRGVLEARYGLLKPGARSGKRPMKHPGDEICCVMKGALRYHIGADQWELHPNDVIHFKCDIPHHWENASRGRTEVLWVFSEGAAISF